MTEQTGQTRQTRRRGNALEEPIMLAAWTELAEAGFADFQMSRVAERAQASKATLYRRWPDRHALVLAALRYMQERAPRKAQITGDLRTDLLRLLRDQVEVLTRTPVGPAVRGLLSESRADAADLRTPKRLGPVLNALAAAEPTIDAGSIPRTVTNLGVDLVSHHYIVTGEGLRDVELIEIVDLIWLPALQPFIAGVGRDSVRS